jgi:hypothetical protein
LKVAFLFPGQGVTIEREGRAWCERSEAVRRLVGIAARHAGVGLDRVFEPSRRGVMPTELLEPVHTALCLGVHDELARRGVRSDIVRATHWAKSRPQPRARSARKFRRARGDD